MKHITLTLIATLMFFGCAESFDSPRQEPERIFNITTAAGRAAPTPRADVEWPEAGPKDDVGGVVSALTACNAAKQKVKARYGCSYGWVETSTQFTNESGSCSNGEQYLVFKTYTQPTNGTVKFEVDRKQCIPDGMCGWVLRHYVTCTCDNTPCTTSSS